MNPKDEEKDEIKEQKRDFQAVVVPRSGGTAVRYVVVKLGNIQP